jgi:alanine dehydrogenase
MKGALMKIKVLGQKEIKRAVTMVEAIESTKQAFISLARGEAILPLRTQISVKRQEGTALFMPAYLPGVESLGAKIVSVYPYNAAKGLSTIFAIVILCDAETGQPATIMDGTYLTALRTGAVSGVATDLLARKDAKKAAIIGAGIQGRTQLEAVCCVRKIESIMVYDRSDAASQTFRKEMQSRGKPFPTDIRVAGSAKEAIFEADIVCTATTSFVPVFDDAHLKSGVHINGVGSYTPQMQEIPEATVLRARVVVDSLSASLEEAGDLIIPLKKGALRKSHILGELGQLASGSFTGRKSAEDITFFKSVGIAIQDLAVAELALRRAKSLHLGTEIDL